MSAMVTRVPTVRKKIAPSPVRIAPRLLRARKAIWIPSTMVKANTTVAPPSKLSSAEAFMLRASSGYRAGGEASRPM